MAHLLHSQLQMVRVECRSLKFDVFLLIIELSSPSTINRRYPRDQIACIVCDSSQYSGFSGVILPPINLSIPQIAKTPSEFTFHHSYIRLFITLVMSDVIVYLTHHSYIIKFITLISDYLVIQFFIILIIIVVGF